MILCNCMDVDHKTVYLRLMYARQALVRKKGMGQPFERHHILPKSLGGTNEKSNLVLLTPREHFLAHLLLVRFTQGREKARMAYALQLMTANNPNQRRYFTSHHYEVAKKAVHAACSGPNHPSFGSRKSSTEKTEISRRMSGSNNPNYGKPSWNAGLTLESSDILKRMSVDYHAKVAAQPELRYGIKPGHKHSQTMKDKMSAALSGVPKSTEHKQRLSESLKRNGIKPPTWATKKSANSSRGIPHEKVTCPHCSKTGGKSAMFRWHFDNCR